MADEMERCVPIHSGSDAEMDGLTCNVSFTLESGRHFARVGCPLCAISGLMHCNMIGM